MDNEQIVKKYLLSQKEKQKVLGNCLSMDKKCEICVTIPVYGEKQELVLRCLCSLAQQQGVKAEEFEVILNINNSRAEAEQKTEAFLDNQNILTILGSLSENRNKLSPRCREYIQKIKETALRICILDNSSLNTSREINSIGLARELAGYLAVSRFESIGNFLGIIAITDIDCTFSENYISEITKTMKEHKLNGLSGKLTFEIDKALPYPDVTERVLKYHFGKAIEFDQNYSSPNLWFKQRHNLNHAMLYQGQNMAVTMISWCRVLGMPQVLSEEDIMFGKKIVRLPGETAISTHYWVKTLVRVSLKTGIGGSGGKIYYLQESIKKYLEGEDDKVFFPDFDKMDKIIKQLFKPADLSLSVVKVKEILKNNGWRGQDKVPLLLMEEFTNLVKVFRKTRDISDLRHAELFIIDNLFLDFPGIEVTSALKNGQKSQIVLQ